MRYRYDVRSQGSDDLDTRTGIRLDGVWADVEQFLDDLPCGAIVYWVTYSLAPRRNHLDAFEKRGLELRVICQHPLEEGRYGGPNLRPDTHKLLTEFALDFRGYRQNTGTQDETQQFGRLHAKWLVAKHEDDYRLAYGSFNFANGSLNRNCETFVEAGDEAEDVWNITVELFESAEHIPIDLCSNGPPAKRKKPRKPIDGKIVGGPRDVPARKEEHLPSLPPIKHPANLAAFAEELQTRMCSWPTPSGDLQWRICGALEQELGELATQPWQLLYLPVGVGKTFIALHWLARRLAEVPKKQRQENWLLFAAPNQWITHSVSDAIQGIEDVTGEPLGRDLLVPARPRQAWDLIERFGPPLAVVIDECHNWSHSASGKRSYSALVDFLGAKSIPMLGLTATPCRYENGRFVPADFIRLWLDRDPGENARPHLSLADAVNEKFLVEFEYDDQIAAAKREEVRSILTYEGEEELIGFGEYSAATLRHVWNAIAEDPDELADDVMQSCDRHGSKRVVVFLPPVEDAADGFVDALEELLDQCGGVLFDFRSRSSLGPVGVFEEFQEHEGTAGSPAILVTVDRFREGVNVPDIDMLVMLRATLSPVVAMQALGRGLRVCNGKDQCIILDAVLFKERVEKWELSLAESSIAAKGTKSKSTRAGNKREEFLNQRQRLTRWLVSNLSKREKLELADYCGTPVGNSELDGCLVQELTPKTLVASSSPLNLDVWQVLLESKDLRPGSSYRDALRDLLWCFILEEAELSPDCRVIDVRNDAVAIRTMAACIQKDEQALEEMLRKCNGNKSLYGALRSSQSLQPPSR